MLKIPEELLKLTDKELYKILKDDIYSSKYICNAETLYKIEKRLGHAVIMRNTLNNSITINSNIKNFFPFTYKRLQELKKEKLLSFLNNCNNETFVKYLDKLVGEVFDKEKYDITIDNDGHVNLVLYYPEIIITNSHELSHTMRDIYVKFTFDHNSTRILSSLVMTRTTYTDIEWVNNYIFSHFSSNILSKYYGTFCFGVTELKTSVNLLFKGKFSTLQQVILTFKDYLSWESLEGTPYNYISNFNKKNERYKLDSGNKVYSSELEKIYSKVLYQFNNLKYIYALKEGTYEIKLDLSTINEIEEYLTINNPKYNYFLIDNESYSFNDRYKKTILTKEELKSEVIFKGEQKFINIINTNIEEVVEPPKRIHRSILDYVINKLESEFKLYLINQKLEEVYE